VLLQASHGGFSASFGSLLTFLQDAGIRACAYDLAGLHPVPADRDGRATASATDQELQRSSQAFLADLQQLEMMELRKAAMALEDPERPNLARAIEDRVTILLGRSAYQRRLAVEGFDQLDGGEVRHPTSVLRDWRDAEHRLMEARASLQRAVDGCDRYREEYRVAFTEARERDRRVDGG
jgi:hypothetical protein